MRTTSPKKLAHGAQKPLDTAGVLLAESLATAPMDWPTIFGNTRPVEVEIGSGKGTFILARATAREDVNFLGVEYARAYCSHAADRFRRAGLTNVRMVRTEASSLFNTALPDRSVMRVHIYFPDPWPKRRHHRRRLIQAPFIQQVRRVLILGGQLIVVTDHAGYFHHIGQVLTNAEGFTGIDFPQMADAEGELVGTNFERKYIAQGREFYSTAMLRYR